MNDKISVKRLWIPAIGYALAGGFINNLVVAPFTHQPMVAWAHLLTALGILLGISGARDYLTKNKGDGLPENVSDKGWKRLWIPITGWALFGGFFIKSRDKEILDAMQLYTNISSSQYVILALLLVYRNALQGLGHTFIPLMGGAAELVMRAFAALVLARFFGFVGVAWSHPLAWYGAFILLIIDYRRVIRKLLAS